MIIETNTWHYRWYNYWLTYGRGNKPQYQENLCHYVRVLLFWAPGTWMARSRLGEWSDKWGERFIAGFMILYCSAAIIGGLTLLALHFPMQLAMAVGSLAGLLGIPFVIYQGVRFVITHEVPSFGIVSTAKLTGAYVIAKKRRICPFLTFQEPAT